MGRMAASTVMPMAAAALYWGGSALNRLKILEEKTKNAMGMPRRMSVSEA